MTDIISAHQIVGNGVRAIYRTCTHLYGVFESDAGPEPLSACPAVPWPPGVLAAGRWEPGRRPRLASTLTLLACCCEPATCGAAACPPRPRSPPRHVACERGARASGATSPGRAAGRQRPAYGELALAGGGGLGARAAPGGESREGASGQDRRGIGLG